MAPSRIVLLVIGVALIAQAAAVAATPTPEASPGTATLVCNGKYKGGLKPSPDELAEILKKHAEWGKDGGPYDPELANDPRRANLCGANLFRADLRNVDLRGAYLEGADLSGARLDGAHLEGANLINVHLSGAELHGADLSYYVYLDVGTWRIEAKGADLSGADLYGADLYGADLNGAEVAGADFDIRPDAVPDALDIYAAHNLSLLRFSNEPAGLVRLRAEFKDMGMRTQEAQLTCAIRRSDLSRKANGRYVYSWPERAINTVFFDWTCQYGMSPGRPLLLMLGFGGYFTILYAIAQYFPRLGGIWIVWDEPRLDKTQGSDQPQRMLGFPSVRLRSRSRRFLSAVMLAAYFSLLSALRIGWSGLNFGTWISRMQLREYSLHASEWIRVVSGIQSLVSVYLVALAILTYFGTPFEY
jgi:Pentapeptide repeats (8 copies)